ncbi:uncharacterized protein LOC127698850 isoform X1 [Mytilus californianus]|uniref:uncharacterized protein LOC127698850 isoform X1 n=1 Tax=Mytilus californianus TaxID=6549 RepID=UPI0022473E4A|nr:uncharacterized protein LOC127698850 isoform X1 [Mytilus californianus]
MAAKISEHGEQTDHSLKYTLISTTEEARALFQRIEKSKQTVAIGFDMEADNIGDIKNGKISIIQIKLIDEPPYIIDIHGSQIDLKTTMFNEIMKSTNIETIIQDPRNDSKMLYEKYRTELKNVFDPQSFQMTVENKSDPTLATRRLQGKRKSLDFIYETYVGPFPNKNLKEDMKKEMKSKEQRPKLWMKRPLTREMALYAATDVETLLPIRSEMEKYLSQMEETERYGFVKTFQELCIESIYTTDHATKRKIMMRKKEREFEEATYLQESDISLSKAEREIIQSLKTQRSSNISSPTRRRKQSPYRPRAARGKQRKTIERKCPDVKTGQFQAEEISCKKTSEDKMNEVSTMQAESTKQETQNNETLSSSPPPSPARVITRNLYKMNLADGSGVKTSETLSKME